VRRAFATNWWARQWIAALERFGWAARLARGRSYARSGHVVSVDIEAGRIDARVKGSRPRPYTVRIELPPLGEASWDRVADLLVSEARYAASLLAGEMPADIEEAFQAAGCQLFPRPGEPLVTSCSCPDWANPCKHVAAVHYVLGSEFDRDPFLLFRLRGRTKEALLNDLRVRRSCGDPERPQAEADGGAAPDPQLALSEQLDRFWTLGEAIDGLQFNIASPHVPEAILKRLGSPTPAAEGELPRVELARLYRTISERAIRVAYEDGEE
jgi:uncharacterized Zn finger protein